MIFCATNLNRSTYQVCISSALLCITCYTRGMGGLSHADAFFMISSFGTILFMVLVGIILYQVIKLLRIVRIILERVEAGSERLAEDLAHMRALIAQGGIVSRILGFFLPAQPRRRKKTKSKDY